MTLLLAQPILEANRPQIPTVSLATLGIILVGNDPSSEQYIALKEREAQKYGVTVKVTRLPESSSTEDATTAIEKLNTDATIHGIIVQLPLPEPIVTDTVLQSIHPTKDVDNLTGMRQFESPMVLAVEALAKQYEIVFPGKNLCLVGHGKLIGQPLEAWLTSQGCKVSVVDATTENGDYIMREANILFGGTGVNHIINDSNTRQNQIVFDCSGVDVDFEAVKEKCLAITPPKGSIGPLTVHFLLTNTIAAGRS